MEPTQIAATPVGVAVQVLIQNDDGKRELHAVPIDEKQAKKLLNYVTHQICGDRLVLNKEILATK